MFVMSYEMTHRTRISLPARCNRLRADFFSLRCCRSTAKARISPSHSSRRSTLCGVDARSADSGLSFCRHKSGPSCNPMWYFLNSGRSTVTKMVLASFPEPTSRKMNSRTSSDCVKPSYRRSMWVVRYSIARSVPVILARIACVNLFKKLGVEKLTQGNQES